MCLCSHFVLAISADVQPCAMQDRHDSCQCPRRDWLADHTRMQHVPSHDVQLQGVTRDAEEIQPVFRLRS